MPLTLAAETVKMSAHTSTTIYLKRRGGHVQLVAGNLNKEALAIFSKHANRRFKSTTTNDPACVGPNPFLIMEPNLDVDIYSSIQTIARWIDTYDFTNPVCISIAHIRDSYRLDVPNCPSGPTFKQAVDLYFTCYYLFLDRELRGDALHHELIKYTKQLPLSLNEFQMIIEVLSFDKALVDSVKNQLLYDFLEGKAVPEWDQIVLYCQEIGIWGEMQELALQISDKVKKTKEREVAGRMA